MPGTTTPDQHHIPPTHQDFRWISGPGQEERFAAFIEFARDIAAGVNSSLHLILSSELTREINLDAAPGDQTAPAIGKTDADNLFRLSLAATALLRNAADEHIAKLNQLWDE